MKNPRKKIAASAMPAVLLLAGVSFLSSCEKDILTGQPEWLGNSIYERLQDEGNYSVTLRLIEDLGQKDVLSQTGSKTLFVADDNAYNTFFGNNTWGVTKYEDLTTAQKKLLLNSAMINNAYLVELLSRTNGNMDGKCMRRETAVSVYDSVGRIYPGEMPNTTFWQKHKGKTKGMVLLRDNSAKPMIHFLPAYMQLNKITDGDLQILTNGVSSSTADAWVNGKKIVERDIVCKNGYIHKVDGVMTSADNMAEIIKADPRMSQFSQMLNRFCAPYYNEAATADYARLYNSTDSVFVLKYFSGGTTDNPTTDPDGNVVDSELLFDPGWNRYPYSADNEDAMKSDAGAILVPTNEALNDYWNNAGRVLQDMYKSWDNVPLNVLSKLVNNNLINSFSETVPSKFKNIVDNTTKVSLGIEPGNVVNCYMGCNGVVYLINKVFAPADYSSVSFPALVNEHLSMGVIYWAISKLDFEPYLNSMDSYYSFFIPTDNSMVTYIDPCSYGSSQQVMYQFYKDKDTKTVKAHRFTCNMNDTPIRPTGQLDDATDDQVKNRLTDLLDNLIVVGNVEDGHTYYKAKGGSMLKVANAGMEGTMTVSGGLQIQQNTGVLVDTIYNEQNGKSYIMRTSNSVPMSSPKSVYATLKDNPEYSTFFSLLNSSKLLVEKLSGKYTCADKNISLFDVYNYTVYAPTNESLAQLHDAGVLPLWSDYAELMPVLDDDGNIISDPWNFSDGDPKNYDRQLLREVQTYVSDRINDFLRYHIQDNSVMIGASPSDNVKYETFKINPSTKRFYSVTVTADDNSMRIVDQMGNTRNVVKAEGQYNNLCRDVWIDDSKDLIYNSSDAVVHSIDGALFYDAEQMTQWRDEVKSIIEKGKNKK